ncbi:MAG: hypothetical protein ABIT20_17070 [Gemmatimonadaceae bacterium]
MHRPIEQSPSAYTPSHDGLLRDDELEFIVGGLERPLELPRDLGRTPAESLPVNANE